MNPPISPTSHPCLPTSPTSSFESAAEPSDGLRQIVESSLFLLRTAAIHPGILSRPPQIRAKASKRMRTSCTSSRGEESGAKDGCRRASPASCRPHSRWHAVRRRRGRPRESPVLGRAPQGVLAGQARRDVPDGPAQHTLWASRPKSGTAHTAQYGGQSNSRRIVVAPDLGAGCASPSWSRRADSG